MEIFDRLFPSADKDQCCWLIGCAGEVAANMISAGGFAITLRVGNWKPNPDPAARQTDPEVWDPGVDVANNQVTLECLSMVHPAPGLPQDKANPFTTALYPTSREGRATSIMDIVGEHLEKIPFLTDQGNTHTVLALRSTSAFYSVPKIVSALFGTILARGGTDLGLEIYRGPEIVEKVTKAVIEHSGKVVVQKNADGTITHVPVQRSRSVVVDEKTVPIYMAIDRTVPINNEDLQSILGYEGGAYSPVWTLAGLLGGKYVGKDPHEEK